MIQIKPIKKRGAAFSFRPFFRRMRRLAFRLARKLRRKCLKRTVQFLKGGAVRRRRWAALLARWLKSRSHRRAALLAAAAVLVLCLVPLIYQISSSSAAVRNNAVSSRAAAVINQKKTTVSSSSSGLSKTVIIDPGHGGADPGAIGVGGVYEKTLNLEIGLKLRSAFQKAGYKVIMTRSDDRSIYSAGNLTLATQKNSDLNNRVAIIQSHPNAFFISIHQNESDDSTYSGTQVYYSANKPGSETLAELIQSQIEQDLEPNNKRQIHTQEDLRVLKDATIPAVLVECGFISNASDAAELQNGTYQDRLVADITKAAETFYGQSASEDSSS